MKAIKGFKLLELILLLFQSFVHVSKLSPIPNLELLLASLQSVYDFKVWVTPVKISGYFSHLPAPFLSHPHDFEEKFFLGQFLGLPFFEEKD